MEKTNAMISEKEKVLQELEGRVKEIVREKTRLAEQLEELKRVIRRLQLGSVVRRKHVCVCLTIMDRRRAKQ